MRQLGPSQLDALGAPFSQAPGTATLLPMNAPATPDWIVPVSSAERAASRLSPESDQAARAALKTHGAVILRGAFPVPVVDEIRAEFDRQWGGLSAGEMAARAQGPAPNPVLRVGENRFEILVRMQGALGDPRLFANHLLCSFLVGVLDQRMKLSGMTAVLSYPGAQRQHIHSDSYRLFDESGLSGSLPHYAINVALPLVDVDQTIGPTAIWLGSHLWNDSGRNPSMSEGTSVDFLRGDCILIDYRTLHAGLPNTSTIARPILYMVYARTWFFDEDNHRSRPSLDMPIDHFMRLPPSVRELVTRAFSQRIRAHYFSTRN
ncbi:MAG: phytanoyl-CoA dioxygenase family protein [Hyphomonadaceae bacterium]